jgi:hypothetical protein
MTTCLHKENWIYRGYLLWDTTLGGIIPCYSTLASPLSPPPVIVTIQPSSSASSSPTPSTTTSAIDNVVYAMQYSVDPPSSKLPEAAKIGIGAGSGTGALAIAILLGLLLRKCLKRRYRRRTSRSGLTSSDDVASSFYSSPRSIHGWRDRSVPPP